MLDKKDVHVIKEIVNTSVSSAFSEFFEKVLTPYLDTEHKEIMRRFDKNDKEHKEMKEQIESIGETVGIHERRIRKLETIITS